MEWLEYLKYPAFVLLVVLIYFTVKMAIEGKDKREQAIGTLLFVYLIILANRIISGVWLILFNNAYNYIALDKRV